MVFNVVEKATHKLSTCKWGRHTNFVGVIEDLRFEYDSETVEKLEGDSSDVSVYILVIFQSKRNSTSIYFTFYIYLNPF